ncbi:MAG: hypothetical protein P8X75_03770 [Limibacillus sp.]
MAAQQRARNANARGDFAALRDRVCAQPEADSVLEIALAPAAPGQLLDHLMDDGRCVFAAAPEPTLRELIDYHATTENVAPEDVPLAELKPPPADVWARYCAGREKAEGAQDSGWTKKGDCLVLQSLVFPQTFRQEMRVLAAISEDSALAAGRGLYLAFGALSAVGEAAAEPFLLLPVALERPKANETRLHWRETPPFVNPNVIDLLGEADAAKLPALGDRPEIEAFLQAADEVVARNPDLKLEKGLSLRCMALADAWSLRDLRRAAWEMSDDLGGSAALRLLSGDDKEAGGELPPAGADVLDETLETPLPFDAGQGTLIAAAMAGRPVLALGSPETGKTHAAAALAAAFLGDGKTVLYLSGQSRSRQLFAERLREAALGGHLLALEPDGLTVASLSAALTGPDKAPEGEDAESALLAAREALEPLRKELQSLQAANESPLGALALKVNNILFELGRLKLEHPRLQRVLPEAPGFDPLAIDDKKRRAAKERLLATEAAVAKVSAGRPLAQHPWAGVTELSLADEEPRKAFLEKTETLRDALKALSKALNRDVAALDKSIPLNDELLADLRSLAHDREALEAERERILAAAGLAGRVLDGLRIKASNEPAAILAVEKMVAFAKEPPEVLDQVPRSLLTEYDLDDRLEAIEPDLMRLVEAAELLSSSFDLEKLRALGQERLREMAQVLRKRGLFKSSDSQWRAARSDLKKVRRLKGRAADALMPDLLEAAAQFFDDEAAFFEESEAGHLLGEDLESAAFWHAAFKEGRDWVTRVEEAFDSGFARQVQIGPALIALELPELAKIAETEQDEAFADLRWTAGQLAAADRDWGFAKASAWSGYLGSRISAENARHFSRVKCKEPVDLLALASGLATELANYDAAWDSFIKAANLRQSFWLPGDEKTVAKRLQRVEHALSDPESLTEWVALMTLLNKDREPGVVEIMKAVVAGAVPKAGACDLYDLLLFQGLAKAAEEQFPQIGKYDAEAREALLADYLAAEAALREALAKVTAQAWTKKRSSSPNVPEAPSEGSLEAFFAKLLEGEASAAWPCMAMTPDMAARLLPAKAQLFDLVILDDADCVGERAMLPGLLRAKQLAAFADPLPQGDPYWPGVTALLREALPRVEFSRHYGALPDALALPIAKLAPFDAIDLSIQRRDPESAPALLLRNEWCEGARNLDPQREAKAVAAAVVAYMKLGLPESLAVVTLDEAQAQRIEQHLDLAFEEQPDLAAHLAGPKEGGEPLVIAPLSELPALTRDVIILSPAIDKTGLAASTLERLPGLLLRHRGRLEIFCGLEPKAVAAAGGKEPLGELLALLVARGASLSGGDQALPKRELGRLERSIDRALSLKGLQVRPDLVDPRGFFLIEEGKAPFTPLLRLRLDRGEGQKRASLRDRELPVQARERAIGWTSGFLTAGCWSRDPQKALDRLAEQVLEVARQSRVGEKRQA